MKFSSCPGQACRHYHIQDDYSKYDQERGIWYKFTAYFCKNPLLQEGKNGKPRQNRQVPGGSPIGFVCNTCKGKFYEART